MDRNSKMVGNFNQLVKVRRIMLRDGRSEGIKALELMNEEGLYMTCIEDQCLNIYDFSYKGMNFAFQTKNGLVSNRFFNGGSNEFSFYWPAGMLYTCGLSNVGPGVTEDGIYHAEHGRIGMMPAENVAVEYVGEEYVRITGTMHDSLMCGYHFELQREILFPCRGKEVILKDKLTNLEGNPAEFMLLYHCNFGYPLLEPGARLEIKNHGEIYDTLGNGTHPESYFAVTEPRNDKIEEVYCHINRPDEKGYGMAIIRNDKRKLGGYVKHKMDTLPYLIEWKNMCSHDYAMGLEPSNNFIKGRDKERDYGSIPVIGAYESLKYEVRIGVLLWN